MRDFDPRDKKKLKRSIGDIGNGNATLSSQSKNNHPSDVDKPTDSGVKIRSTKAKPFAIRLTDDERKELERRAGEMALGTYIKIALFAEGVKPRARGMRVPVKDHVRLAELLALLGSSRLSESMHKLSEAASTGTLYVDDDVPIAIKKACNDICVMRLMLMQSLGFRIDEDQLKKESLTHTFTRHARTKDW
ncbi:MAG: hypothetical protein JJ891_16080 [Rhizobiaceae bacterium]|jgi:hypothetical protein|nr:hypothetical protein [Rhizobiaceae bacterium]